MQPTHNSKANELINGLKDSLGSDEFIFCNVYDIIIALRDAENRALAHNNKNLKI